MRDSILLVEDNPDDVTLALMAFKEIGAQYEIAVARDGAEALDYLFGTGMFSGKSKAQTPLLILLDLRLPRIGGLEVLKKIRGDALLKYLVVVVLSASDEEVDKMEAKRLGSNLYFRKPSSYSDFLEIVRRIDSLVGGLASP